MSDWSHESGDAPCGVCPGTRGQHHVTCDFAPCPRCGARPGTYHADSCRWTTGDIDAGRAPGVLVRKVTIRGAQMSHLYSCAARLGTESQRERAAVGFLSEDEILQLARDELFRPLASLQRWSTREDRQRITSDMRHRDRCGDVHGYAFVVTPMESCTDDEWPSVKVIRAAQVTVATHEWLLYSRVKPILEMSTHRATCTGCKATGQGSVAKVTIQFCHHMLVREYAL